MTYPVRDNLALVDSGQVASYFAMLFGYVDWTAGQCVNLRGIGENGTPQEGTFRERAQITPPFQDVHKAAMPHVERWGQHQVASFVIPAVMDGKGERDENVVAYTALVVDIDKGDAQAALAYVEERLGWATMIVASGGVTETGQDKLHVYWRLKEPSNEIPRIAALRKTLAEKIGGDPSFGRLPQVIRIPGSVYAKGGVARQTKIIGGRGIDHELEDLAGAIIDMVPMPGLPATGQLMVSRGFNFGGGEIVEQDGTSVTLGREVHAGGAGPETRFDAMSRIAGLEIQRARRGDITLSEAYALVRGFNEVRVIPPWPEARVRDDFARLAMLDRQRNGAFPEEEAAKPLALTQGSPQYPPPVADENPLYVFAAERLTKGKPVPVREFLVDGLIRKRTLHLLAADGGAGKTFLILDLARKIATYQDGDNVEWLGKRLPDGCAGTVIIITTEDDSDELHIRLVSIDPMRSWEKPQHKEKLIIIPTINAGGTFTLCATDRAGNVGPSASWLKMLELLAAITDLRLVIIDTLNATMHGNENDATTAQQYTGALSLVIGRLGAAVIVTHHTRKSDDPIRTPEDMLQAIRGSSALIGAFRCVIGIWPSSDYARRLKAMGQPVRKGSLFHAAVTKANNPEMMEETRSLLRQPSGLLMDATSRDVFRTIEDGGRLMWLLKAIELAAAADHAYTRTGDNGCFKRKAELPPALEGTTRAEYEALVDRLLEMKLIVTGNFPGSSTKSALDVASGLLASGQATKRDGAYAPPEWGRYKFDPMSGTVQLTRE